MLENESIKIVVETMTKIYDRLQDGNESDCAWQLYQSNIMRNDKVKVRDGFCNVCCKLMKTAMIDDYEKKFRDLLFVLIIT